MDGTILRRAGDYARLLFEEATDGVFVASPDGVYLEVNRSGHQQLGYAEGELVGRPIASVILERDQPRLLAALSAVAGGHVSHEVWQMLRKDGQTVPLEVRAQRLSNGAVLAIVRDLGTHSELERQTQASEAKLRSILSTAPDIVMTVDRTGRISFINRTLTPLTVDQVVGTSCFDYVLPESRERVARAIEHVFETREIDTYEIQGPPNAAGQRSWMSVRAGPQLEGDRVLAATLCATDVTAYKQEVARTRELLDRLAKIASLVPGVVFQYQLRRDGSAIFPYASERIREVFRVSPEEAREDARCVLDAVHPADRDRVMQSIIASARALSPWKDEFRVQFADGEVRWHAGHAVAERSGPEVTDWHGLITDVTERKQAEAARAKLEEQLLHSQKMESIGQLAGGVAHDFNNLLTAVMAFVDLTQDELPAASPVTEYLEGIRTAAQRGAALTQQLLAFARKKIVRPEDADLNEVLQRMAPMVRRLVGEHISVQLDLASDAGTVRIDVGGLEQVIMNLIVNARDAMPTGGTLKLETQRQALDAAGSGQRLGSYAVLAVTDTGVGMTPEIQARLFEPFFTTKPPGVGTGLGLATCLGVIEQAGGHISVRSERQKGSTFAIHLPAAPARARPAIEAVEPRSQSGHERLLLVEDEPTILRVARAALERLGYTVLSAGDGAEALELAERTEGSIDLLVTDIVMPRLGGRELSAKLRERHPRTRVLYTSGYAESAIAHQGVLLEGVRFLQKPYTLAALARCVREALDE
jgi:two-component system cell cycle sensor histidine kinase/response regulator CckA